MPWGGRGVPDSGTPPEVFVRRNHMEDKRNLLRNIIGFLIGVAVGFVIWTGFRSFLLAGFLADFLTLRFIK